MATFCDMAYTWDANKNKTSESITGVMSGYGFTSAGTTYDNEDLCISSSLPPPASSLLVNIDANGTADVNCQYDALGRRVARSGTGGSVVYVQMDQQTIADYPVGGTASTPTYRYVYASYIDEPVVRKTAGTGGTLVHFHRNHQYSVTAVTTSTGAIAERYAYSAYGQPTILDASASVLSSSAINNRYTYTGREWDATLGLHHFRARWMSPSAGRFLGRDPIEYVESTNLYLSNLSFTRLDSSGKLSLTAARIAGKDNKQNYCSQGDNNREYIVRYYLSEKPSCDGWLLREVCVSCGFTECPCKKQSNNQKDFKTKCYYEADRVYAADYEGQNGSVHAGDDTVGGFFSSFSDSSCGKYSQVGITIFVCDEQLKELLGVNGDVDNNPETWKKKGAVRPKGLPNTFGHSASNRDKTCLVGNGRGE
jgi:RHS repeat-associated protein